MIVNRQKLKIKTIGTTQLMDPLSHMVYTSHQLFRHDLIVRKSYVSETDGEPVTVLYRHPKYHLSPPLTHHHNLNINAQDLIPITTIADGVDGVISVSAKTINESNQQHLLQLWQMMLKLRLLWKIQRLYFFLRSVDEAFDIGTLHLRLLFPRFILDHLTFFIRS